MLGNVAIWGMVMYNVRKAQYIVVNHYFMEATILKKLISIILFVFITGVLSGCSKAGDIIIMEENPWLVETMKRRPSI